MGAPLWPGGRVLIQTGRLRQHEHSRGTDSGLPRQAADAG